MADFLRFLRHCGAPIHWRGGGDGAYKNHHFLCFICFFPFTAREARRAFFWGFFGFYVFLVYFFLGFNHQNSLGWLICEARRAIFNVFLIYFLLGKLLVSSFRTKWCMVPDSPSHRCPPAPAPGPSHNRPPCRAPTAAFRIMTPGISLHG